MREANIGCSNVNSDMSTHGQIPDKNVVDHGWLSG